MIKKLKKASSQIDYKKCQSLIPSLLQAKPKNSLLGETFIEKKKKKRKKTRRRMQRRKKKEEEVTRKKIKRKMNKYKSG